MGKTYKDTPSERQIRRETPRIVRAYGRPPQLSHRLLLNNWEEDDTETLVKN